MREGYSTHFVCLCVCVSLTTLEATLIYSAKNEHQWTANGILFILKKLKSCKLASSIQKQLSKHNNVWWTRKRGHLCQKLKKIQITEERKKTCFPSFLKVIYILSLNFIVFFFTSALILLPHYIRGRPGDKANKVLCGSKILSMPKLNIGFFSA